MKRTKSLTILLAFICLCTAVLPMSVSAEENEATGKVYYVSSSEGDDSNDGLSQKTPFQTLARVSELELTAGDQLLFKCDDIWYGTVTLELSKGTKDNPILISSYGKGERPSLRYYTGHVTEACAENVMVLWNCNGVEINNLDVGWSNAGIRMEYNTVGNKYVRIENCHFHDIYGTTQKTNLAALSFSSAIYTRMTEEINASDFEKDGYPLTDFYINRCTSYDGGALPGYTSGVKNLYITECIAENNGYYGAVVTATGGYIDRCVFDNNGTRSMPVGSCGIMLSTTDFTIKNSIVSNQQRQNDDPDGCGIDFEWDCKNVTVENVLFEGNAGVGIMFFTSGNTGGLGENRGTNYDCTIKNCKFVNNNTNIGNIGGYEIYVVNAGADRCVIENNEYVIDYTTECETVAFQLCAGEYGIDFNNNVQVDAIDEAYNPLNVVEAEESNMSSYTWLILGLAEGCLLVIAVYLVVKTIGKKGAVKNEI